MFVFTGLSLSRADLQFMSSLVTSLMLSVGLLGGEPAAPPVVAAPMTAPRYFVVVFAAQNRINTPQQTHTWVTFVQWQTLPDGTPTLCQDTISWLPADYARTLRLGYLARCGANFSLHETLRLMTAQDLCIRHCGPCEIDACLYEAGMRQLAHLRSGDVRYKLFEPVLRRAAFDGSGGALHCTHATTDVAGFVITGATRGHDAGELVMQLYSPHILGDAPPWLFEAVLRDCPR
jgi:hypothetical protein